VAFRERREGLKATLHKEVTALSKKDLNILFPPETSTLPSPTTPQVANNSSGLPGHSHEALILLCNVAKAKSIEVFEAIEVAWFEKVRTEEENALLKSKLVATTKRCSKLEAEMKAKDQTIVEL
ncbi:unnamed protein product, partial [Ilex paraguariensis]